LKFVIINTSYVQVQVCHKSRFCNHDSVQPMYTLDGNSSDTVLILCFIQLVVGRRAITVELVCKRIVADVLLVTRVTSVN